MVTMTCSLCGFEYVVGGEACRSRGCPLSFGTCRIEHCPRCAYAVPSIDGGISGWLKRILSARRAIADTARPRSLADVAAGSEVVVERIEGTPDVAGLLTLLGVTSGSTLRLCQRFPTYVVAVDGTEMAFERSVAESVIIR